MNLRDKLRAVGGSGGGTRKGPAGNRETESGDCRHLAVYRAPEEFPGAWDVRRETLEQMSGKELPEPFDPRRILYLDTETTGLGGAGTVAFLVGMGYLTDRGFEVHQFLMRDYDEEPYLLRHVEAGLNRFDMICTFNGASFDVPLLESRFLMNRRSRESLDLPHIDLLHIARRLWKSRLGGCSLSRLEEMILGKPREDDLPGSLVPQRYFEYLKTKREELLEDILRHNAQDIASLCVLLTHIAGMYEHPETVPDTEDVYAMGRSLERFSRIETARKCYRLASRGRAGAKASAALAYSYRRTGDREQAAEIWRRMIAENQGGIQPYIELAKYLEHVRRDIPGALETTERALIRISGVRLREDQAVQETENELQYRRRRLKRKLAGLPESGREKEQKTDGTGNHVQGQ